MCRLYLVVSRLAELGLGVDQIAYALEGCLAASTVKEYYKRARRGQTAAPQKQPLLDNVWVKERGRHA